MTMIMKDGVVWVRVTEAQRKAIIVLAEKNSVGISTQIRMLIARALAQGATAGDFVVNVDEASPLATV